MSTTIRPDPILSVSGSPRVGSPVYLVRAPGRKPKLTATRPERETGRTSMPVGAVIRREDRRRFSVMLFSVQALIALGLDRERFELVKDPG